MSMGYIHMKVAQWCMTPKTANPYCEEITWINTYCARYVGPNAYR